METLHNGVTLHIPQGAFPLSTDSILLSGFVRCKKGDKILDLGSGCATLGVLLCANNESIRVTGIELDAAAHKTAVDNIERNDLAPRLCSICGDIRDAKALVGAGSFDVCVSNPPYFSGGPVSKTVPFARHNNACSIQELFCAAAWALRWGGDFYLVHKPELLPQLMACAVNAGLEPKQLQLVRHSPESPISLVLLQCRKGAKPNLKLQELCLHHSDGSPTEAYRKLYHI